MYRSSDKGNHVNRNLTDFSFVGIVYRKKVLELLRK